MEKKPFTELGLSDELLKAIERIGYEEASPIQTKAIPILMGGADLVGQSQTGSGKTAAFAIPAIEKVDPSNRAPQVLILCPTRELALQVAEEVAKLAAFKRGVRELPIYGGQSYERQFRGLHEGAQILIGTPGRLMDHLDRGTLRLDALKMIVLDEADRMLDMGFVDDIRVILEAAPAERQTVFFSATLPRPIRGLIETFARNPVNVSIAAQTLVVPEIEQVYYEVDRRTKADVLCRIIDSQDIKLGLIFCATKVMVDELAEVLQARGYAADKLHGDMSQAMRERVVARFRQRKFEFLVATDVAARGLDVEDIEVVFNYSLPNDSEDYVHRIGRTGRAGKTGRAVTFVSGREIYKLQNIIRAIRGGIRRERVPTLDEVEEKRVNLFFESLRETLEKGEFKRHDAMIDRLLDQEYAPTDIASALIHLLIGDKKPDANFVDTTPPQRPERDKRPRREEGREAGPRDARPPRREKKVLGDREDRTPRRETREHGTREERPPRGETPDFVFARRGERRPERGPADRPEREREDDRMAREPGMTRLVLGLGREHGVAPGDIVGVLVGLVKVPKESVGSIRLQGKQSYVDVKTELAEKVVKRLDGIEFKRRKLWCKQSR
jgi:ATP-dependent RNA helicase DeaD